MIKYLRLLLVLTLFALMLNFSGCDSNDDGGNGSGTNPLIGTWELTHVRGMFEGFLLTIPASSANVSGTISTDAAGDYEATFNVMGDAWTDVGQWYSDATTITFVTNIDGETVSSIWGYTLSDNNNTLTTVVNAQEFGLVGYQGDYDLIFSRQ